MVAGAEPALSRWTSRAADDSWFSTQLANRGGDSKNPMRSGDPAGSKSEPSVCWLAGLEDRDRGRRSTSRVRRIVDRGRNHFRWVVSLGPKPRRDRCHRGRRAAGCHTSRGVEARRSVPSSGHSEDPPERGRSRGTRPRMSDEPQCTLTTLPISEMPDTTSRRSFRPKAMDPSLLFPIPLPRRVVSLVADATPNRKPPGWRPVADRCVRVAGKADHASTMTSGSATQRDVVARPEEYCT